MINYSEFSDVELVELLQSEYEDIAAYTAIYDRYRKLLVLHANRMLGDVELAKDVVQELFTTFYQQRKTLNINTSLSAYLYKMVRNKVFNNLKHAKVKLNYAEDFFNYTQNSGELADEQVCLKELADAIESEIEKLPIKMREIFELSRKQFLSHQEIATRLNLSKKTVNNQINLAIKKISGNNLLHT
ncbi:RNA polymerase sigma-70 factor [Pedobacter hiemivivus]|uniref:RNA polymerase sigma-70 factor n=1 Tax=Pedobacter hiemivivus TaxID=2530454 RepID=A0A4U1GLP3_9SPHI|nr:RNA polymerase sigma-70 factor [Pedobacter hiemivivus]TKC62522.1 RNA polymerase sigma-70 factor [Pedobacter hiemivivus]